MSYCGCAWHKDLPLHEAIVKGEIDVVKSLVESEADIEEVDCGGNTALLLAIKVKQVEIIVINKVILEIFNRKKSILFSKRHRCKTLLILYERYR